MGERGRECVLGALLGQIPVAGHPDQRRHDVAPLLAECGRDRGLNVGHTLARIGRTSTAPPFSVAGCLEAA